MSTEQGMVGFDNQVMCLDEVDGSLADALRYGDTPAVRVAIVQPYESALSDHRGRCIGGIVFYGGVVSMRPLGFESTVNGRKG